MSTQSVLDQMTAGIMSRKEEKAVVLTPVGLEATPSPAAVTLATAKGDVFPFDGGLADTLNHSIAIVRKELAQIEECLRSIEREAGTKKPEPFITKDEQIRSATAASEAKSTAAYEASLQFKADMARKEAEAKAQVFGDIDITALDDGPELVPVTSVPADGGWMCPEHDGLYIKTQTSRKGRTYRTCGKCMEFER